MRHISVEIPARGFLVVFHSDEKRRPDHFFNPRPEAANITIEAHGGKVAEKMLPLSDAQVKLLLLKKNRFTNQARDL